MKLVELLARELSEWPAGFLGNDGMTQDKCGDLNTMDAGKSPDFHAGDGVWHGRSHSYLEGSNRVEVASDYATAVVTKEQWQAERDRQKGGEWKRHRGGPQPVDAGTNVEVKLRCGDIQQGIALDFVWRYSGCDVAANITQYRLISQPQAEEVEMIKVDPVVAANVEEFNGQWQIGRVDGPLVWRDTVIELDAYIEEFTREREALINRLAEEGFALIPPVVSVVSGFSGVDMSDWNNWQVGDVIKVISNTGGHEFAIGTEVTVITVDKFDRSYRIEATAGGNDWWLAKGDGEFIRRP